MKIRGPSYYWHKQPLWHPHQSTFCKLADLQKWHVEGSNSWRYLPQISRCKRERHPHTRWKLQTQRGTDSIKTRTKELYKGWFKNSSKLQALHWKISIFIFFANKLSETPEMNVELEKNFEVRCLVSISICSVWEYVDSSKLKLVVKYL